MLKCYHPYFFQTEIFFGGDGGSLNDSGLFCPFWFDGNAAVPDGVFPDTPASGTNYNNTPDHDNIAGKYKIEHHKNGSR